MLDSEYLALDFVVRGLFGVSSCHCVNAMDINRFQHTLLFKNPALAVGFFVISHMGWALLLRCYQESAG